MEKKRKRSLWDKIMYMDTFTAAWLFGTLFAGAFILVYEYFFA